MLTFLDKNYELPPIHDVKYLKCEAGSEYYYVFDKEIRSASGNIISTSNSKANFSRGLDSK